MSIIDSETERHAHLCVCVSVGVYHFFFFLNLYFFPIILHFLNHLQEKKMRVGDEIQFMPVIVFSITASLVCTLSQTVYSEMMHWPISAYELHIIPTIEPIANLQEVSITCFHSVSFDKISQVNRWGNIRHCGCHF